MAILSLPAPSVKPAESFADDLLAAVTEAGPFVPPTLDDESWWDQYQDREEALRLMYWRDTWDEYAQWSEHHDLFGRDDY
jgi:hypothetical protein